MQRIRQFDGVRALAILAVFAHHALHVKLLWMGVDLFFVLSGFLITGVLLDSHRHSLRELLENFYARRVRRILVPYLVFLVLASLVIGVAWARYWYFYVLLTNLLLPLHVPHPGSFAPLWSLAVEEQFYLAWPFAVYLLSEERLRKLCILLIVLAPVLRGCFHFAEEWPVYMLTPFRMDLLACGGWLCLAWRRRRDLIEKWGAVAGIPLTTIGLIGLFALSRAGVSTFGNTRTGNIFIYEACLLIAVGIILYALSGWRVEWLKIRPLTYIGQISYSMYLVHLVIIEEVFSKVRGFGAVLIAFALVMGYASISWFAMEKRLLGRHSSVTKAQLIAR